MESFSNLNLLNQQNSPSLTNLLNQQNPYIDSDRYHQAVAANNNDLEVIQQKSASYEVEK